jgi:hypothetical protein
LGRGSGVGAFFSGGLDAFHTALRHREEISHLIYLHLEQTEDPFIMETNARKVREAARDMGKPLIVVDTNLREFAERNGISEQYYHGMGIAGVALLLQHKFRKVLIAGSTTSNYDNLRPMGTHPILDPLWGTELTDFCHDGCEVRRVEKAADVADCEVVMRHLQVCAPRGGERYNCGHCKKCVRTMLNLMAAGALERCKTLPDEIDLANILRMDLSEYSESYFARENLRALKRGGAEPEVVRALEETIERGAQIIAHSGYKEENLTKKQAALDQAESKLRETRQEIRELRIAKREEIRELRIAKRELAQENSRVRRRARSLAKQNSRLRYQLVDSMLQRVLKIPGVGVLLQEIHKRLRARATR